MLQAIVHRSPGHRRYRVTVERTAPGHRGGGSYCVVVDAPTPTAAGEAAEYVAERSRGGLFRSVDIRPSRARRTDVRV